MTWDFRRYLGVPLSELGVGIPWGEAARLIAEVLRETGSHAYADIAGLQLAASQADFASILHAEAFLNVNRDRELMREPVELPAPFDRHPDIEPVTPEEYEAASAYLATHSAFRDE